MDTLSRTTTADQNWDGLSAPCDPPAPALSALHHALHCARIALPSAETTGVSPTGGGYFFALPGARDSSDFLGRGPLAV